MPRGDNSFDILIDIIRERVKKRYSKNGNLTEQGYQLLELLEKIRLYINERLPARIRCDAFLTALGLYLISRSWVEKNYYIKEPDLEEFYRWILWQYEAL